MKTLMKLHWQFVKHPSYSLETYFPKWSIRLGLFVYAFHFLYNFVGNPLSISIMRDALTAFFGINSLLFVHFWILLDLFYIVLFQYYLMPIIVRSVARISKNDFDSDLYRKIIFYSPSSSVIYSIIILLPIRVISSFLLISGQLSILSAILIGVLGILGLWSLVLIINMFVIQWKGLNKFFEMSGFQIILAIFVFPFLLALPTFLLYGPKYLEFMQRYIS